jgi:hypothetical protein
MFILTVHWDMRLLWAALTITSQVLYRLRACSRGLLAVASIAIRFRRLLKHGASSGLSLRVVEMTRRVENLRQFHGFLFLLFGICCVSEVFATLQTIQYSSIYLSVTRIDVFEPVTAFAFFAFAVLLFSAPIPMGGCIPPSGDSRQRLTSTCLSLRHLEQQAARNGVKQPSQTNS